MKISKKAKWPIQAFAMHSAGVGDAGKLNRIKMPAKRNPSWVVKTTGRPIENT
jgi:hypothetical protein